jgi:hypothetical protein
MPTVKRPKIIFPPTANDRQYIARCQRDLRERDAIDQSEQAAIKLALALAYEKLGKVKPTGRPSSQQTYQHEENER